MRFAISGALGKMGQECVRVFGKEAAALVDRRADGASVYTSLADLPQAEPLDAVVDFSAPGALADVLAFCVSRGIPAVLAVTGYSAAQQEEIAAAAKNIPILASRNMSVGVHLLGRLCKLLAAAGAFDIEIVETHHAAKRDAPSGTALYLADLVRDARGSAEFVYDRRSRSGRKQAEIGLHAVRGGSVVGEHAVHFFAHGETLTLTHRAEQRELFARGAYAAARFLVGKPPRLYTMEDLIAERIQIPQD